MDRQPRADKDGNGERVWSAKARVRVGCAGDISRALPSFVHACSFFIDLNIIVFSCRTRVEFVNTELPQQPLYAGRPTRSGGSSIIPAGKSQDISVIVWCVIRGDKLSDAIIFERDFKSKKHGYSANSYIQALEQAMETTY